MEGLQLFHIYTVRHLKGSQITMMAIFYCLLLYSTDFDWIQREAMVSCPTKARFSLRGVCSIIKAMCPY